MSRSELFELFAQRKEVLPINSAQLSKIGTLCQRLPKEVKLDLCGRMKEEVTKACLLASKNGFGQQIPTAIDVLSPSVSRFLQYLKPIQPSLSSQFRHSEVITFLFAAYFAIELRKTLGRHQPKKIEQTKTLDLNTLKETPEMQGPQPMPEQQQQQQSRKRESSCESDDVASPAKKLRRGRSSATPEPQKPLMKVRESVKTIKRVRYEREYKPSQDPKQKKKKC